jgi:predicted transcriptional regulator
MEKSGTGSTQKIQERRVSGVAIGSTFELAFAWKRVLASYTPKAIAKRIGASPRTIDNWRDGENGPTWKHTVAMLNDEELCARLLEAAGRSDLANAQETIVALRKALGRVE